MPGKLRSKGQQQSATPGIIDCYASIKIVLADGGYRSGDIIATAKRRFRNVLQVVMGKQDRRTGLQPVSKVMDCGEHLSLVR